MTTAVRNPSAALPFWAWCTVAVFCTALYTTAVPVTTDAYDLGVLVALAVVTVQCGSLVLAVPRPLTGTALQLASVVALALVTRDSGNATWPLPVTGFLSLGALILLLGLRERWYVSLSTWWLSIVVLAAVVVSSPERYAVPDEWGTNLTVYAGSTAMLLIAAIALGQRHRIRADLERARRDVELEQAQRLYVEERARIARELHDVVAHSMSLIHMQALSAPFRLRAAESSAVDQEFEDIARSARGALDEMRQLLGALRSEDDDPDLVPQPQLADIDDLVTSTSRAGIPVEVELDPRAGTASPIVQLTIYRIVQEALSNVVRHAPGAATTIDVSVASGSFRVSVRNARAPSTSHPRTLPTPDRGGAGLRGMRERVGLLGGQLSTGPADAGGFLVDATIPSTDQ
ncbi:sensor histidine kinase [Auraticoccus monumenti]|nr:histidine kinase [Auraticoccus monumenti]